MNGQIKLQTFEPNQATQTDLEPLYELSMAALRQDRPDPVSLSYDEWVEIVRQPAAGFGPRHYWLVRRDGELVGKAVAHFPENENERIALTEITVSPSRRRQGVGTAVLLELLPKFEVFGRTAIVGWELTKGGAGAQWAAAVGLRTTKSVITQTLVVEDIDRSLWDVPVPEGFRLHAWAGAAPEELVASYVRALFAMRDAPAGESQYKLAEWTVERVREAEAKLREQNVVQRVVVAVDEATGEVAALTQLDISAAYPTWGLQQDTAVVPEYRGNGLGRCIKAHMLRSLLAERPAIDKIFTSVNAENKHMIRVNDQIGFTTTREAVAVSAEIAELQSRFA